MAIRFSNPFKQAHRKRIEKEGAEERIEEKLEDEAQKISGNMYKEPEINSFAKLIQLKNKENNKSMSSFAQLLFKNK